jgi:hypothetical protein
VAHESGCKHSHLGRSYRSSWGFARETPADETRTILADKDHRLTQRTYATRHSGEAGDGSFQAEVVDARFTPGPELTCQT